MELLHSAQLKVGHRPTDRLYFINIDAQTLEHVRKAGQYVQPEFEYIIDQFYENMLKDETLKQIVMKHSEVEKLKVTLRKYLEQFFQAELDEAYIKSRVKIGQVHSDINVSANYFIMSHNLLVQFISAILMEKLHKRPDEMIELVLAVQKLASFDQQLVVDVYNETTFKAFYHQVSDMLNSLTELDITQRLIEAMDEQLMEAHNITAATEEMSSSIQDASNHAVKVVEGTKEAVESAENSQKVISQALHDIGEVGKVYEHVMEDVNQLGREIDNTHEVIDVIKEIADQTNLLALNASIEAARAGEAGQGFAVVATEVRKLSEHTKEQIDQITSNMVTLQTVSKQVTDRIKATGERVQKSVTGSQKAQEELDKIVQTMQAINEETTQIAAMSEEQSSTVVEISERNANMADLSEEVQGLVREAGETIYQISKQMDEYRLKFLDANLIYNAKDISRVATTDHLLWKWRIYNMMLGFEKISLDEVTSHDECRLGKWYYSNLPNRITSLQAFKDLEEPHKKVHQCAKRAVEEYLKGNIDAVKEAMNNLEAASKEVVSLLKTLEQSL